MTISPRGLLIMSGVRTYVLRKELVTCEWAGKSNLAGTILFMKVY
jgi:hypothetical protein